MAFTGFSRILPDPYNPITTSGAYSGTSGGPGFASIGVGIIDGSSVSRTNTGKVISTLTGGSRLAIKITYNDLTRTQFDPLYGFLTSRNCKAVPFFLEMPQYTNPLDSTFYTFASTHSITTSALTSAGKTYITVGNASTILGLPKPNSLISIQDSLNTNHTKVYLITRVETNTDYETSLGAPGSNKLRLHLHAPLSKSVSSGAVINFISTRAKVLLTSSVEYQLTNDGLYQLTIQVEEAEF